MAQINPTIVAIASPKVGQPPSKNVITGTSGTKIYVLCYNTASRNGTTVNWLKGTPVYTDGTVEDAANMEGFTTYAEMAAFCTTNGIANLPAQVAGQP